MVTDCMLPLVSFVIPQLTAEYFISVPLGDRFLNSNPISRAPADAAAHLYGFRFGDTSTVCSLSPCPQDFRLIYDRANLPNYHQSNPNPNIEIRNKLAELNVNHCGFDSPQLAA
jgi:hypothetical protein